MKILILGSGAGGGFPQWNCNCPNCRKVRNGDVNAQARSQSSLAVSVEEDHWFLLNASPDLRDQINNNPALHPKHGLRHSPIDGAVLTNADVDHIGGLLTVRESQPLSINATERVLSVINSNSVFNILNPEFVKRNPLPIGTQTELCRADGTESGILIEAFPVPGKVALYLEDEAAGPNFGSVAEDTIGLQIEEKATGKTFFYFPGCAHVSDVIVEKATDAELVFFDGTTWIDNEMQETGVGHKTGQRMGHMSVSGEDGSIAAFSTLNVKRKIYIHMNNTNPILIDDSPERLATENAGWEIGFDGMEVSL
ncbi:MAG: pyrroloquinoline quinone biosynthesis protein PqqB [Rhodospirillales bacterium]|nr:pyrroloquinoline quinone biosynthesis protein PqqB [Rhodospirillales bacterium]